MADESKPMKKAIRIKLDVDEKLAGGTYANVCMVNHSDSEFVLDCFFLQPQRPAATHGARVVLSPRAAKRLQLALADHLRKFEASFGQVELKTGGPENVLN